MKTCCLALLIFLSYGTALAQNRKSDNGGSAEYGMLSSKWPCQEARDSENRAGLKSLRKSILWNTFGTDTKCLEEYLNDDRLKLLEIHLINEVCQRNNNCGPYEFLYGIDKKSYESKLEEKDPALFQKVKNYIMRPSELIDRKLKAHTACFISPGLESNLSKSAMRNLISIIKPAFQKCRFVWNPVDSNSDATPIRNTVYESHGSAPALTPPCIANLDGEDIHFEERPSALQNKIDASALARYFDRNQDCNAAFLWVAEFNGIESEKFIDPRERLEFPDGKVFDLVNSLLD